MGPRRVICMITVCPRPWEGSQKVNGDPFSLILSCHEAFEDVA